MVSESDILFLSVSSDDRESAPIIEPLLLLSCSAKCVAMQACLHTRQALPSHYTKPTGCCSFFPHAVRAADAGVPSYAASPSILNNVGGASAFPPAAKVSHCLMLSLFRFVPCLLALILFYIAAKASNDKNQHHQVSLLC